MLTLFKIDDKNVKNVIKNAVGAKEGDFNGQSMLCGTTINPVVVINKLAKKLSVVYLDVIAVQNTWYTVCELTNIFVNQVAVKMKSSAETLEFEVTIDDVVLTGNFNAVADTNYWMVFEQYGDVRMLNLLDSVFLFNKYDKLECPNFMLKIRKTTAVGANNLVVGVSYQEA